MKSANYNDFYRYLNTHFSTTINLICSIKVPIGYLTFVEGDSVEKHVSDPSILTHTVRKFEKCLILLTCLDNQAHISH